MGETSYFTIYVTHVVEAIDCPEHPNHCNLVFWGQRDRGIAAKLEAQITSCVFGTAPIPSLNDLKKEKIVCVLVNSSWLRATITDCSLDSNGLIEVFCIDYGLTQNIPLGFIRLLPQNCQLLRNHEALASKYLLADVVIDKGLRGKEPALLYLKMNVENRNVKAVALGIRDDFEGVRVYVNDQLLAKLLVDSGLGHPAATYSEAVKEPPPITRFLSMSSITTPTVVKYPASNWGSYPSSIPVGVTRPLLNGAPVSTQPAEDPAYRASFLEQEVVHLVIVTNVQNGPEKFTLQRKSAEFEQNLAYISRQLSIYISKNPKRLLNPTRGKPCVAVSPRDEKHHRGLVTYVEDQKFVNVYFVDYGYTELVEREFLFEISPDFVALELQAIRVSLDEAYTLLDHSGATDVFTRLVLFKSFKCKVVSDSVPQNVILYDEAGQSVKDLVVAVLRQSNSTIPTVPTTNVLEPRNLMPVCSGPALVPKSLKIAPAEVEPEERVYVTYVDKPGQFFGQFEKRPENDLKELETELLAVYGDGSNTEATSKIPLLYADVQSHVGDNAVIRWSDDGNLYRVKIVQEFALDIEVFFVDYGNKVKVSRREIWAPVTALKLFTQPPFGIQCVIGDVNFTLDAWTTHVMNKSLHVRLNNLPTDDVYPAALVQSAIPPPNWVQTTDEVESSAASNSSKDTAFQNNVNNGRVLPKIVTEPVATTNQADDFRTPANSLRVAKEPTGFLGEPERRERSGSASTVSSFKSTFSNRSEKQSLEHRLSPKRVMPISQPIQFHYLEQTCLEEVTRNVEVVFAENPNSFYCQLEEATGLLDSLMGKLENTYADPSKPCVVNIKTNLACVANYTGDGAWYRGQILRQEGTEVEILFVDYGNKQLTPVNLVKAIEEEFVELPPQAYHCSLADVPERSWTSEDKTRFEEISVGKKFTAKFTRPSKNAKYLVTLTENKGTSPLIVNTLFAPPPETVPAPDSDYSTLPISSEPQDVNVAWFYNPCRFFLSPIDISPYQEHLDQLEAHYSSLRSNELIEDSPFLDMPCVVRFQEDQCYYRSQILSFRDGMAEVLFVDYGNEQDTPLKELKRIHPRFMKFPQLTWQCRLKDVKLASKPVADAKKFINDCFLTGGVLSARFHPPKDGYFDVEIMVPKVGDARQYLLKHGVLESTIVEVKEKKIALTPQKLDFVLDETLSTCAVAPYIKSPAEFWIQLNHESVDEIMERLDVLATNREFIENRNFVPSVGKPCLAYFAEDGRWYRATVESTTEHTSTVYYIDYGNSCSVDNADLRELPEIFAQQPAMAYKSHLYGIDTVNKEMIEAFQALVLDIVMTVKFVKLIDGVLYVRLLTPAGKDVSELIAVHQKPVEIEVYVSYATSPSCFWIQRKQDEHLITNVNDKLFESNGPNGTSIKMSGKPNIGHIYAVNHPEYHSWFRGRVKALDAELAEVHFIDYGDTHTVRFRDFRILSNEFKKLSPLAIPCRLNFKLAEKGWSEEAIKYFNSSCSPEELCRVVLGHKHEDMQLIDSMHTSSQDVFEALSKIQSLKKMEQIGLLDNVSKTSLLEPTNATIPSSMEAIDNLNCTPGQVLSTKASAVVITSPTAIWLQLDPAAADTLMISVQDYVGKAEFQSSPPIQPSVGCFCLALFPDDQRWYRAVVESVNPDFAIVQYIDYGNSSSVPLDHLRALPQSLSKQPALALKCALDGVDRNPKSLPTAAQCQDALFNQTLSVTFIEKTPKELVVRLHNNAGKDFNKELLHSEVVQEIKPITSQPLRPSHLDVQHIPEAENVKVSYIRSAGSFWIQRGINEETIEQIRDNLRQLDGDAQHNETAIRVREGQLYAIMHPEYNRFYRARVNKIHGTNVEAFFLDYGDTRWTPLANVRPIPAMLTYIPAMATECTFRTPIYPDQYCEEIQKAFRDATDGVTCQAVFSGVQPANGVQQIESLYARGIDVVATLSNLIASSATQARNAAVLTNLPILSGKQQRGL